MIERAGRTGAGLGRSDRWLMVPVVLALALLIAACGGDSGTDGSGADGDGDGDQAQQSIPAFDAEQLAELPTEAWITNGGNVWNQRYSPLDQIDRDNVDQLKGEWKIDLDSGEEGKYSAEAQPIYYDGVIYVATGEDDVFALDAEDGEQLWKYEGDLPEDITTVCCGWTSRGVAIGEGQVFLGKLDGTLVGIDAETGEETWSAEVGSWQDGQTITSAPLYYDGMVVTGLSGGEFGIRGRVTAHDAETGEERWRFWTIPGPGEDGNDTWAGDSWKHGGAPVWQTPAVDPELGLMYFSTGNTAPDFDGTDREGKNLYANSIIAVDARTGEYEWHFQQVHHGIWDYDAASPVVLFDLEYEGEMRKGLAQPSKAGWVYILDRETGEPLVGIEEREVPQNEIQHTWPTQPYPEGDSFVPQMITQEEVDYLREQDPDADWKYVNEGRIFTPFAGEDGIIAKPATLGGNNWPPSSFNPEAGHLYVCAADTISVFTQSEAVYEEDRIREGESFLGSAFTAPEGVRASGTLTAMDMRDNTIAWQNEWDDTCYSGTVNTAGGLVFVGRNSGHLTALDNETGEELWRFQTGAGANNTVTTYEHDGTQYVVFYAGGSSLGGTAHGDNVWLFSLEGDVGEAPEPVGLSEAPEDEAGAADEDKRGEADEPTGEQAPEGDLELEQGEQPAESSTPNEEGQDQ